MRRIVWTVHALANRGKRVIEGAWVEDVVKSPLHTTPDPGHPRRTRAYGREPEGDRRMLRVVYEIEGDDLVVVTVTWDRNAGRRI